MEALSALTIGNNVLRARVRGSQERLVAAIATAQAGCTPGTRGWRLRAFVLLLRFSGMRISNVVNLSAERFVGKRLFLCTKTGVPVHIVISLAVAHSHVGNVLQAQGKLGEAQAEFEEFLTTSRRLAELDPSNARWQREFAVACVKIARLESKVGTHTAALALYGEASRIFDALVKSGPGFVQWAKEKELVDSELALCRATKYE